MEHHRRPHPRPLELGYTYASVDPLRQPGQLPTFQRASARPRSANRFGSSTVDRVRRLGFPGRSDASSLNLCLFTSWGPGAKPLVELFEGIATMIDNSKRTGARSSPVQPPRPPSVLVAAGIARLPCREDRKGRIFTLVRDASGCIWRIPAKSNPKDSLMKKVASKLLPVLDILLMLMLYPSAWVFKIVRAGGYNKLPRCKDTLIRLGVFPIRNHYYEPQFYFRKISRPFSQDRFLPGQSRSQGVWSEPLTVARCSRIEGHGNRLVLPRRM